MRTLSFEEAQAFLAAYPKIRDVLDREGEPHAERLTSRITDPHVLARLRRGTISDAEDVRPLGPVALRDLDHIKADGRNDDAKLIAAAFAYLHGKAAHAA